MKLALHPAVHESAKAGLEGFVIKKFYLHGTRTGSAFVGGGEMQQRHLLQVCLSEFAFGFLDFFSNGLKKMGLAMRLSGTTFRGTVG